MFCRALRWLVRAANDLEPARSLARRFGYHETVQSGENGYSRLTLSSSARRPALRVV